MNNTSLDNVAPSRTRSLGKTSGVAKQNSRDVIVSSKKKSSQGVSQGKSQNKMNKPTKELQNFLNQGPTTMNYNSAANLNVQALGNVEEYKKQLLVK